MLAEDKERAPTAAACLRASERTVQGMVGCSRGAHTVLVADGGGRYLS